MGNTVAREAKRTVAVGRRRMGKSTRSWSHRAVGGEYLEEDMMLMILADFVLSSPLTDDSLVYVFILVKL